MPTRGPSNTAPQRTKRMASGDVTGGMTESADGSPPTFGQRLRAVRTAHGLTLQQVADAVGCTKAYIWELESRTDQRPTARRMIDIARLLGVTVEFLIDGHPMDLTAEDSLFMRDYLALPDAERARMRRILKAVA